MAAAEDVQAEAADVQQEQDVQMAIGDAAGAPAAGADAPQQQPDVQQAADQAAQQRSKPKQKKRGRGGGAAQEEVALVASQAEHVRIVRVDTRKEVNMDDKSVVQLSKVGRAPQLVVSEDRRSVTGHKGFRTVRGSHGVFKGGLWYCEVEVVHLGATGHVRLGWCTQRAELQAPVGFDGHGYCYRDLEGSKVHRGLREPYGRPYKEGDVVGLLIYMPEGGRSMEQTDRPVARYKGALYYVEEPEPEPQPLKSSQVAFSLNGELQGVAYSDVLEGTYYPAASLYTMPQQAEGATVRFNFGPDFKHTPPQLESCPPAQPLSSLAQAPQAATPTPGATAQQQDMGAGVPSTGDAGGMEVEAAAAPVSASVGGRAAEAMEVA